jgi:serine/threonine protein kinase
MVLALEKIDKSLPDPPSSPSETTTTDSSSIEQSLHFIRTELDHSLKKTQLFHFSEEDEAIISRYAIMRCRHKESDRFVHDETITILTFRRSDDFVVYARETTIGSGQEGTVYLARSLTQKKPKILAVKERDYLTEKIRENCLYEYRVLDTLKYARDFFGTESVCHLFMKYFSGLNASLLPKDWPPTLKASVATGFIRSVRYLHKLEIIHGDIKTDNFIILPQDEWVSVQLVDYGSARFFFDATSIILGTPIYQPPECFELNRPKNSEKTDLYSLATCVLDFLSFHSYLKYQLTKPASSPICHGDLEAACPDVYPSERELSELRVSDPWKYELIIDGHAMHCRDLLYRPSGPEVDEMMVRLEILENEGLKSQGIARKSRSQKKSPRDMWRLFSPARSSSMTSPPTRSRKTQRSNIRPKSQDFRGGEVRSLATNSVGEIPWGRLDSFNLYLSEIEHPKDELTSEIKLIRRLDLTPGHSECSESRPNTP